MKEIVNRLHENRQVELAKSILESKGYTVTKRGTRRLKEGFSVNLDDEFIMTGREAVEAMEGSGEGYEKSATEAARMLNCSLDDMIFVNNNEPCGIDFSEVHSYETINSKTIKVDSVRSSLELKKDPETGILIVLEDLVDSVYGYGESTVSVYFSREAVESTKKSSKKKSNISVVDRVAKLGKTKSGRDLSNLDEKLRNTISSMYAIGSETLKVPEEQVILAIEYIDNISEKLLDKATEGNIVFRSVSGNISYRLLENGVLWISSEDSARYDLGECLALSK